MKYPKLVPKWAANTPVEVVLYRDEVDENGTPVEAVRRSLKCSWQDSAHTVRTQETTAVTLTGTALFDGDIAPALPVISGGKITVFGEERTVVRGTKNRNPDGTVNYTRLDVM